jgi:uncharacterized zinc-type alcohol dehydrogenase-like protein
MVPGHEIIGKVVMVGPKVKKWKVGDTVGVGCFVDSDRTCEACKAGEEQYCESGPTLTYNGFERDGKTPTYGGYSTRIVVDENYVLSIPKGIPLDRAAPLLCAGITTYSPLKHFGLKKGDKLAVVGLGGLGHMGVKFGHAMGAHVTVLSHSPGKRADALKLGVPKRRRLVGSMIGGIRETQEMLDFCAKHGIASDVEVIPIQKINEAYERMLKNDVRYRFVIDLASLKGRT